jgi:hypothetical protein
VRKFMLLAGAVLGAALIWQLWPGSMPANTSQGERLNLPQKQASSVVLQAPAAVLREAPASATAGSSAPPPLERAPMPMPELTRPLQRVQSVPMAGRSWSVLGTKDVVNDLGKQVVLVLRDEISGQLEYRQSALRVVLRQGVDYETFISARSNARRLFVNTLYGEIAVDAASIGDEYKALVSDPQVQTVSFIPLAVPIRRK